MTADNVLPFRQKEKLYTSDNLAPGYILGAVLAETLLAIYEPAPKYFLSIWAGNKKASWRVTNKNYYLDREILPDGYYNMWGVAQ